MPVGDERFHAAYAKRYPRFLQCPYVKLTHHIDLAQFVSQNLSSEHRRLGIRCIPA